MLHGVCFYLALSKWYYVFLDVFKYLFSVLSCKLTAKIWKLSALASYHIPHKNKLIQHHTIHTVWLVIFVRDFFLLSPRKQTNCVSIRPTSNYLAAQTPTEACQRVCLDGYCSSHPGKSKHYVSTDAWNGQEAIVATNVLTLGTRLLFLSHWNKEPRLQFFTSSAFGHTAN